MKRFDFFTRLVLGFVAIWKAPEILAKSNDAKVMPGSPKQFIDRMHKQIGRQTGKSISTGIKYSNKWFEDNYSWLRKWIENYRVQSWKKRGKHLSNDEYFDGMQVFSDTVGLSLSKLLSQKEIKQELKFLQDRYYEEHVKDVVRAAVFSRKVKYVLEYEEGDRRIDCMSGFVEQMGRLPVKEDKVRFVTCSDDAKGSRFLRIRYVETEDSDTITFLSDCRLEIEGNPDQRLTIFKHGEGTWV